MKDFSLLHAYIDGQLTSDEQKKVESWIKEDPKAQAELEAIQTLKGALKRHCEPLGCEETWAKCQKRLEQLDRRKGVESFVGRWAWGLCSIFIVSIVSAAWMNRVNGPQIRSTDLMSASLAPLSSPQSQATGEQRRWLRDLAIPLEAETVKVEGAYEGEMNGQRVIRLDIRDAEGNLQLFVASCREFTDATDQQVYGAVRVGDMNGLTWSEAGMSFLLVGPRGPQSLQAIADGIRR